MPKGMKAGNTIFEYVINKSGKWEEWLPEESTVPKNFNISEKFSSMLIPTMDSVRAEYIMNKVLFAGIEEGEIMDKKNILIIGDGGTAKTSTVLLFLNKEAETKAIKRTNFSSATSPYLLR